MKSCWTISLFLASFICLTYWIFFFYIDHEMESLLKILVSKCSFLFQPPISMLRLIVESVPVPCESTLKWGAGKITYRLITAYLLLRVNLDKIMHAPWDFDVSSARTRMVSALDKHQNRSASALFCLNSRAQSKYAVVNLIHTRRKQTFLSFIMW